jgi:phosphatidylserine decarboxylase
MLLKGKNFSEIMNIYLWILVIIGSILLAAFLFWKFWFLRQPKRTTPKKGIVSPASGTLIKIIPYKNGKAADIPKGMLGKVKAATVDVAKEGYLLVIMLTPLDVHYQRSPVDGVVEKVTYAKGLFKNAVIGAQYRLFENEKNEILIVTKKGKIKVVQVAGVAARRIKCYVKAGERVKKGQLIGLINLGSQVVVVLPKQKLLVKENDYLIDGETVIA